MDLVYRISSFHFEVEPMAMRPGRQPTVFDLLGEPVTDWSLWAPRPF